MTNCCSLSVRATPQGNFLALLPCRRTMHDSSSGYRKPSGSVHTCLQERATVKCGKDKERGMLKSGALAALATPGQCLIQPESRKARSVPCWGTVPNSCCPNQSTGTSPDRVRASALASEGPYPCVPRQHQSNSVSSLPGGPAGVSL